MESLRKLRLWLDPVARPGPEAMAVDEWLLETAEIPVLRVYRWLGHWGSVGYFGSLGEAMAAFQGVRWVRRWTGGGTVDHRTDWTYTVVAPAGEALAGSGGADSYRMLHAALAAALVAEGIDARLSTGAEATGAALCFENPVSHDLIDHAGRKLAGAGQRRTRRGLLHQGSVAAPCDEAASQARAERLAAGLADAWNCCEFHPPAAWIAAKVHERYALPGWTERR
jgi:lipoate-protein ligase A